MAALVSRPSSLASAPPSLADRLREGQRIADPPDDERARDDVLLVARQHLGVAGLVDATPHVEPDAPDRSARAASSAGRAAVAARSGRPKRVIEHGLALAHDDRGRVEDDGAERDRPDDAAQPALRLHGSQPQLTSIPLDAGVDDREAPARRGRSRASPDGGGSDTPRGAARYCDSSVRKLHASPAAAAERLGARRRARRSSPTTTRGLGSGHGLVAEDLRVDDRGDLAELRRDDRLVVARPPAPADACRRP